MKNMILRVAIGIAFIISFFAVTKMLGDDVQSIIIHALGGWCLGDIAFNFSHWVTED